MKSAPPPPSVFRPGEHRREVMDELIDDPYFVREKFPEPTVCSDCGAVFHEGRWQWTTKPENAHLTRCPACSRIHDELPAGYLTLEGEFLQAHKDELLEIARNLEAREKAEHPLQRIMAITEEDGKVTITTTALNLARGIGEALKHAYKGELQLHYSPGEYLLRAEWRR
jgi:NMD protein affecting ribosome stability and mRNA decay